MIKYNTLIRYYFNCNKRLLAQPFSTKRTSSSSDNNTTSSSSSSDDEKRIKKTKPVPKKSAEALEKLNLLLNEMIKEEVTTTKPKLDLAKAKDQRRKNDVRSEPSTESVKTQPVEKQVVKAVKDVAQSIGGDVKQTESELLQKLLNPVTEQLVQSASLTEIFKDMKIDRESSGAEDASRAQQVRQMLGAIKTGQRKPAVRSRDVRRSRPIDADQKMEERVNLFKDKRLNIFPSLEEVQEWPEQEYNKTWKGLHERELRLAVTHPPSNYFQQMILWTEQGKIWKFPIDNEQDSGEEKKVYFTEHVFLEKHLEPWCPPKGPIRHFMELVCVGLSKNHYLTVDMKKEHIEWFRSYFVEKKQLLQEVGAIPQGFDIEGSANKQIEP